MKRILAILLSLMLCIGIMGCTENSTYTNDPYPQYKDISYEDALTELDALLTNVKVHKTDPVIDLDYNDSSEADSLADISTYPIVVTGNGEINIEIAADTELSTNPDPVTHEPVADNLLIQLATQFNKENHTTASGKRIGITVRQITGGETVTYIRLANYRPDLFIPSHAAWGKMLDASGVVQTKTLCDRMFGNTAGVLISDEIYDDFIKKYGEATIKTCIEATLAGDMHFAYTNPYSSSTGLNMLTMILKAFDEKNPLSQTAINKLNEYQRTAPPTAATTAIMKTKASRHIINAMVMEEQTYILSKELSNYIYVPQGIRHDHPAITFTYVSDEKQEAAQVFVDYCLTDSSQKLAYEKGFNRHDDYKGEEPGLDGHGYLEAQALWKEYKNGGRPVVAVFIADVSGSMNGNRLSSLRHSLLATMRYINSSNYIGLISYSNDVTINLPIAEFDEQQKAMFSGAVNKLTAGGETATYNAVCQGMKMLLDKQKEIPDAQLMLFLLTDGAQNQGLSFSRIASVAKALKIPTYCIAYETATTGDMNDLAGFAEAEAIGADVETIVNKLRSLFNSEL